MVFASAGAMEAFEAWVAETSKAVQAQAKGTRPASRRWVRRPWRRRWRGHCRPVPAGTMSAFEAWAKVTSPTVAQAATTKTEVWKKAGLATV